MAETRSYMKGYERDKRGYVFDPYLTVDHLGAGRPAESVRCALLRAYYTGLLYYGAN
jgi:hypothetical protein